MEKKTGDAHLPIGRALKSAHLHHRFQTLFKLKYHETQRCGNNKKKLTGCLHQKNREECEPPRNTQFNENCITIGKVPFRAEQAGLNYYTHVFLSSWLMVKWNWNQIPTQPVGTTVTSSFKPRRRLSLGWKVERPPENPPKSIRDEPRNSNDPEI